MVVKSKGILPKMAEPFRVIIKAAQINSGL